MTKDAVCEGEREVRTFVDLFHGSDVLLKKSHSERKGSYHTTMGSLLLTAFTFEAYLNHLGSKIIKFWDEIEKISVLDKYSVLCKELGINPDFSRRPYQTLKLLFRFRNSIAHGRSIVLTKTKDIPATDEPWDHAPKADWEEFCTDDNADRSREDIETIITGLHKTAGLEDYPFIHGMTVSSIKPK